MHLCHQECIHLSQSDINKILLYYCSSCIENNVNLKIIYKNYEKEHTKQFFSSRKILTIHNLYVYHTLLELYKILKFRTPYCMFELYNNLNAQRQIHLNLNIPLVSLNCQKQSFVYESRILWNKTYKMLIQPFSIPVHPDYLKQNNLTNCSSIHYDYSTRVSLFKSHLNKLLMSKQSLGDANLWISENHSK